MCMKIDCPICDQPTWKGCGKHIEQALKDVPEDERCKCPRDSNGKIAETNSTTKTEETKVESTTITTDREVKTDETKENSD